MWTKLLLIAAIVTTSLAGCDRKSSTGASSSSGAGGKVQLALNWKPEAEFGGFYQADVDGLFKKHNLDVEILPGGSGTPTIQMVDAGKVEFGIVSADELLVGRAKNNMDVVALFAVYQTNPQGIMTHASRGFNNLADVLANPGTLAIQRGLPYADFLERKYGFGKVKVVPTTGGVAEFLNDVNFSQQCFVTSEPVTAKQQGGDPKTFLIAEAGYNPYTAVLVTRGDYAKRNPDRVKAIVDATREGWAAYLKDPAKANAVMKSLNPTMDDKTLAESAEAQKPLIETAETQTNGLGSMTQARWDELAKQLVDLKVIDKAPDTASCFMNPAK
jgi:NitT/TauT family transport system substrate-binding protein